MSLSSPLFWWVHIACSLLTAALVLGMGARVHTRLALSHAARRYWMTLWMLAALPPLLVAVLAACMPAVATSLPVALTLPAAIDTGAAAQRVATLTPVPADHWPSLALLLASVYTAGVVTVLLRWLRGSLLVSGVVRDARCASTATWPGPDSAAEVQLQAQAGIAIRLTHQPMSPFAVRWPRPTIVLPVDALSRMGDAGLRLVIRHEAAHLAQRDPQRSALMAAVGALLWFNPFVRRLAARVQVASELCCDAHAIHGDSAAGRVLAGTYVHTLRHYASMQAPIAAMNHRDVTGHALRIKHMLHGDTNRLLTRRLGIGLTSVALLPVIALSLLQMGVAAPTRVSPAAQPGASPSPAAAAATNVTLAPSPPFRLEVPLQAPRITGQFGDTGSVRTQAHRGTDFGTRVGTPVFAPAAGMVAAATTHYPGGPQYGTVVVLDHGNGWQTLYAHLSHAEVQVGQQVAAGERIARTGRTGKVTGPHLHMEALHHGQRIDPETLFR